MVGLSLPPSGEIYIYGKRITGPDLNRGTVPQGYALCPWRTVRKNIEYGLEVKKIPRSERGRVSDRYIELVELKGFEDLYPRELSGGMKQRVAIARALAFDNVGADLCVCPGSSVGKRANCGERADCAERSDCGALARVIGSLRGELLGRVFQRCPDAGGFIRAAY